MDYTINGLLDKLNKIYGIQNNRIYDLEDLFYYHQKFLLRYLESKNKAGSEESIINLVTSVGWFVGIINHFQIDLESTLAKRYSYKCPFCLEMPCFCLENCDQKSQKTGRPISRKPENISQWQEVIGKIYPKQEKKDLDNNLLLRQDNLHQIFRRFRREPSKTFFKDLESSSADYFAFILRILNAANIDLSKEFDQLFSQGCYVCHKTPCQCFYAE